MLAGNNLGITSASWSKFAKDRWRTKEAMKDLKGYGRDQCESGNDKLRALVKRNLFTRHQEPLEVRGAEGVGDTAQGAPGPDGISYRFSR